MKRLVLFVYPCWHRLANCVVPWLHLHQPILSGKRVPLACKFQILIEFLDNDVSLLIWKSVPKYWRIDLFLVLDCPYVVFVFEFFLLANFWWFFLNIWVFIFYVWFTILVSRGHDWRCLLYLSNCHLSKQTVGVRRVIVDFAAFGVCQWAIHVLPNVLTNGIVK